MPRTRNVKPGLFKNDLLAECPFATRYLFVGLWTIADRDGRLEDRPRKIKMELLPADDTDVDAALDDLAQRGFLVRYSVGEGRYIQVVNFGKHQTPHKQEASSTIPAPDTNETSTIPAPDASGAPSEHEPDGIGLVTCNSLLELELGTSTTPPPPPPGPVPRGSPPTVDASPPPDPPPDGQRPSSSGYVELLNSRFPMVSASYTEADPVNFTAGWLRGALAEAERDVGPLDRDRLTDGLDVALTRVQEALRSASAEYPIRHPRAFAKRTIVEALREVAG